MKRWWVKLLLALGAILLMAFVWVLSSSVRSKNAVEQYKDQLRAAGEKLTVDELLPPHTKPESNGIEFFNEACRYISPYSRVTYTNPPRMMGWVAPGKAMVVWRQGELLSWTATNSWADLEQDLRVQGDALDLLGKASERPELDFELLSFESGHLIKMKEAAMLLSAAVVFDLKRGDVAEAVTNLHTSLALVNSWRGERYVVPQWTRIGMLLIDLSAQWELLQATNITDQQLAILQQDWTNMQVVKPMEGAFLMSRATASADIAQLRSSTNSPSTAFAGGTWVPVSSGGSSSWFNDFKDSIKRRSSDTLWRLSWSYDDELHVLEGYQVLVEAIRQVRTNGYFKDALAERDRKLMALGLDHANTNWLRNRLDDELAALGPDYVNSETHSLERLLTAEAARKLASTAIALKRYQLVHATLPKDLNALVPEFLSEVPRDPMDGQPLRYRLNPDGTFLLYSIGDDGRDDGGDPTPGKFKGWQCGRDWVWPQPATAAEIQKFYDNPPK